MDRTEHITSPSRRVKGLASLQIIHSKHSPSPPFLKVKSSKMDLSFLRSIFKTTLLFVGVALIQAAADSPADGSAIAEAIPQPNLAGFVLRNQYTDFTCVSDPLGTSGTALNSCLPQSANPSTNYTMTFSGNFYLCCCHFAFYIQFNRLSLTNIYLLSFRYRLFGGYNFIFPR